MIQLDKAMTIGCQQ